MKRIFAIALAGMLSTISVSVSADVWNSPHQNLPQKNIRYAAFTSPPKTLDPARAYSSGEIRFIAQIYEPPLAYHLLKRPYQLIPLLATVMPTVTYLSPQGTVLPSSVAPSQVGFTVYDIFLHKNILYQPHPAFAKNQQGKFLYHHLSAEEIASAYSLAAFPKVGTRRMRAQDFAYEIKRLASPKVNSPIFGLMSKYIVGLKTLSEKLQAAMKAQGRASFLDLRQFNLDGVKVLGPQHLQIKIKGVYPQFKYWLAMTFFVPIPWEADAFYSQPGMTEQNITFDWYPVGTGPYMLQENNPNKQIVLVKNPNFRPETFPQMGDPGDKAQGYLQHAGELLPLIDKVIFVLDKESIPRWNKFLQGYYDRSGINADSFDQAIKIDRAGKPQLTEKMRQKGVRLLTAVDPSVFYIGFNMLDPVVGGLSEKKKKLRRAIAIAIDYEEYIAIFLNGRGIPAQSPVPPGVFGYVSGQSGINPYVYTWFRGRPVRRSIEEARQLLAAAGYPNGIDPKTKKPLILNYDTATSGSPDDKAHFNWLRKQFAKLGIQLNVRATLYNRFRDKVRRGKAQLFSWGWLADYPDPENFLFLLYSGNGKVAHGGENAANYSSAKADQLFLAVRSLPDGPQRQEKLNALLRVLQQDAPWVFGFHPINFVLSHQWNGKMKPNAISNNLLKYESIDHRRRDQLRREWNTPIIWPLLLFFGFIIVLSIPLVVTYWRRERRPTIKRFKE